MPTLAWALLIIIALMVFYHYYYKHSAWNTYGVRTCASNLVGESGCESYYVHRQHHNPEDAAKVLEDITVRSKKLINHLKGKYVKSTFVSSGLDPTKNNHIDVVEPSELYNGDDIADDMRAVLTPEYIQERVTQLMNNYDSDEIREISPLNKEGNTSYTEDKARLVLCLRAKEKNLQGNHDIHDTNTIMFVVLHELSHMMNNEWGHPDGFWVLFKFVLLNAVEAGIYEPVNYALYPIKYCGLLLTYNPLFDPRL